MLKEKLGIPADEKRPAIMIGAGLNKNFEHPDELRNYSEAADAVVMGSFTLEPRPENDGDSLYENGGFYTLNSYGMPNPGARIVEWRTPSHGNLIASIAGFSVADYCELYNSLWDWGRGVELNFGCPNTGAGKRIFSFDPESMEAVLSHIQHWSSKRFGPESPQLVGVKLSPYSDPSQLTATAEMLAKFPGTVDYVATCNTFPNGKAYSRNGRPQILCSVTKDRGGIGGRALAPVSLGQASQFTEYFAEHDVPIEVLRVGGVEFGQDLRDSELEGCAGVQVVSAAMDGPAVIYEMQRDYLDLVS